MPWEYLSSKPLDVRFLFVAGYLEHRGMVAGKRLVDLNCGTARLLHYIPHTFRLYIANDIHQKPDSNEPKLKFFHLPDFEMPERLGEESVDVLMIFGFADGRLCKSGWESRTSLDSFVALAREHHPDCLIVETSVEYDKNFGAVDALLRELDSYEIDHDTIIKTTGHGGHSQRRIITLAPRPRPYNVHRRAGESIHEYYLRRAVECVTEFRNPKVLKTDACNESHENLPIPGGIALNLPKKASVVIVEWDADVIQAAKEKHPELDLRQGDICNLGGLASDAFDVVLDLSTLDHIQPKEVKKALDSYRRVLKKNGTLLVIFWVSLNKELIVEGDRGVWSHGRQYYFDIGAVRETLAALEFDLITEDHVYVNGNQILDCIKCKLSTKT
jgi:SAM-dependent methyltransferase